MFGFGKKPFDTTLIKPKSGVISGMFFSNEHVGIDTSLFYKISIDLEEFKYDGETQQTSIVLDFINLDIKNYEDLVDKTYTFPVNPRDGYIDGSIYISNMHNPFDVTELVFTKNSNSELAVALKGTLLFEDNSIKPTAIEISTSLNLGAISVFCDSLLELPQKELLEFVYKRIDNDKFGYNPKENLFVIKS